MTRLLRIALVALVATATGTFASTAPAAADCIGPTILPITGELVRGEPVTITGRGWGDQCYDTGPPPPGQGTLGTPADDIEIRFTQGDTDVVVAQGSADDEYRFEVTVSVPTSLAPGEARLWARPVGSTAGAAPATALVVVVVSAAPPAAEAPVPAIAVFGPDDPAPPSSPASTEPSTTSTAAPGGTSPGSTQAPVEPPPPDTMPTETSGPSVAAIAGAVALVVAVVATGAWLVTRRRRPVD
jgi:hypothetical protein